MKFHQIKSFIKVLTIFFLILSINQLQFIFKFELNRHQEINESLKSSTNDRSKSIILMIGDGMGFEHLKLARLVELGKDNLFSLEQLPLQLNVSTYSANNLITDSAAAATAIATGNKTNNGMLSISPLFTILETILEISYELGMSTGIVTTTELTHATPAAFMTHVMSRYDTTEISRQIVENSTVNILLGGGYDHFSISQFTQLEERGYKIINNRSELIKVNSGKLMGLFASGHLPYEIERDQEIVPSLTEMTSKAIEILSQDPEGFFLIVEGGRIDHGAHANNKINVALETIEFSYAVDTAISFSKSNYNTLVLITADHETGGLKVLNDSLNDNLPLINNTPEENKLIRLERANNISVNWATTSHTITNVPFFGYNAEFCCIDNFSLIDNTDVFEIMKKYLEFKNNNQNNFNILIICIGIGAAGIVIGSIIFFHLRRKKIFKGKEMRRK